jgi:hypothetical protein
MINMKKSIARDWVGFFGTRPEDLNVSHYSLAGLPKTEHRLMQMKCPLAYLVSRAPDPAPLLVA